MSMAEYFIEKGFKITGIDVSIEMLALAKYRFNLNHFKVLLSQEDQPRHRVWIAKKCYEIY